MTATGALPPDHPVAGFHDLCLLLGGDATSFTGHLLALVAKADPGNRARLRGAFPRQVRAWELWHASDQTVPAGVFAERLRFDVGPV